MKTKPTAGTTITVIYIVAMVLGIIFACVFCGVGVFMKTKNNSTRKEFAEFQKKGAVQTEGIVVPNDGKKGTRVQYYVEEEDAAYEVSYSVAHSDYPVGKRVTVYYSLSDFSECMFPDLYTDTYGFLSKLFFLIGAVLGGVFFLAGNTLHLVSRAIHKKKKEENLL